MIKEIECLPQHGLLHFAQKFGVLFSQDEMLQVFLFFDGGWWETLWEDCPYDSEVWELPHKDKANSNKKSRLDIVDPVVSLYITCALRAALSKIS